MKTLVEKAKAAGEKQNMFSQEQMDLAVEWARGTVRQKDAMKVSGMSEHRMNWYLFAARALAQYIREHKCNQ